MDHTTEPISQYDQCRDHAVPCRHVGCRSKSWHTTALCPGHLAALRDGDR